MSTKRVFSSLYHLVALAIIFLVALSISVFAATTGDIYLEDIANLGSDGHCSYDGGGCDTAVFKGEGPNGCKSEAVADHAGGCLFYVSGAGVNEAWIKFNISQPLGGKGKLTFWGTNYGGGTYANEKVKVYLNGEYIGTTNDPACNYNEPPFDCPTKDYCENKCARNELFKLDAFHNVELDGGINKIHLVSVAGSHTITKFKVTYEPVQCTPGETQTQPCGNCGTQTRTCQEDGQWGPWSACTGQGPCSPGSSESQGCGLCGTQTRICSGTCQWNPWGSCTGQGVCSPGTTQYIGCDTGLPGICEDGTQNRTCQSTCQWGSYGTCQQDEQPTTEVCNDEDDDCDGAEDEVCATCISNTIPYTMNTNQTQGVSVTVRNDGSVPWTRSANYKLGSQNPQDNAIWGLGRVLIDQGITVNENQQYTFNFNIKAPSTPGTYHNEWRMLKELEFWFLPPNCGHDVTVSQPECTPGQTQSQPCGNCGTQSRTCQSNGQWGSWGSCTGQGICTSGQQQSRGCGTDVGECAAGTETRTCQPNCQWSSYQNCNAIGPTPEECDGLDNDCDTQVDDGFDPEDCEGSCEEAGFVWTGNGGLLDCCGNNPYEDNPYEQYETLCDGNDNDCDGEIDENLMHPCTDYDDCSTFQTCNACQTAPPELCNGDDDDCDGQIDEGGVCDVDCELERISLRGGGGSIEFIDGYTDFTYSDISFSGWLSEQSDGSYYGIMSLAVQAELANGDRLSLRLKGKVADVNAINCGVIDVDNTWWSLATIQVGNNPPETITFDNIHYQWDRNFNLLDIEGEGPDVDFSIEDIQITCLTC